jgi:hypothetical protein
MSKTDAPKSFRFSPEELAELEKAAKKSGSYKAAIMTGIRLVNEASDLSQEQVLDWIKRHTR